MSPAPNAQCLLPLFQKGKEIEPATLFSPLPSFPPSLPPSLLPSLGRGKGGKGGEIWLVLKMLKEQPKKKAHLNMT
jgi:hypothetical protein